jgi:O-antigen/teichoic acid export membrane protein
MQLMTWAASLLVIRLLSPTDYGLVAMAILVPSYLSLLSELGFSAALIQRGTQDLFTLRAVFGAMLLSGGVLCVVTMSTAPFVVHYFDEPALTPLIVIAAIQFLIIPFMVIPQARLSAQMKFRALGVVGIVSAAISAGSTLLFALLGFGAYSLLGGILVSSLARAVALNLMSPFSHMPTLRWHAIRDFVSFSRYVVAERSIWYWYKEADTLIIGALLGTTPVGVFTVAKQIASIPLDRFAEAMNMVALPVFSSIKGDIARVKDAYLHSVRIAATLATPTFLGLAAVAPNAVMLALGPKWESAIPILQLLCLSMPVRLVGTISSPLAIAIGRPDISLRCVVAAAVCVPTGMLIGSQWGVYGVAVAWAVSYPVAFLVAARLLSGALGCRMGTVLTPLAAPIGASLIMAIGVVLVQSGLSRALPSLFSLCLEIIAGAAVYVAALSILSRRHFQEAWSFGRALISKRENAPA